ncbi:hypothetical protein BSNK01_09690 [Bacillaceae bacterium]
MRAWLKKSIPVALAASLAVSAGMGAAYAKNDHGHGRGNGVKHAAKAHFLLKDVKEHWARQTIEKMTLLGVIKGYEDLTFQPNKPVTHAEAVAMVVRLLGLEGEAKARANADLPYLDEKSIPLWAKGSIAVALEKGLLEESKLFQGNKPASRLYVMMLLVNAVGTDFDWDWEAARVYFKDADNLREKERAYLAYAALRKLVSGYEDGTFRPHKPVTRAELAALLERVLAEKEKRGEMDLRQEGKGTIEAVNAGEGEITVEQKINDNGQQRTVTLTYKIDEDARIYVEGKEADVEDLKANMQVEFVLNEDGRIIYLEAERAAEEQDDRSAYQGKVTRVDGSLVWVKVGFVEIPLRVTDDVEIRLNGKEAERDEIRAGQTITFTLDTKGSLVSIELKNE